MRLRYILAVAACGIAVSCYHQDAKFAFIVVLGSCILFGLRRIDYQLDDVKGRMGTRPNVSIRDILVHAAMSPSRQLLEATSELLDRGPAWEFHPEGGSLIMRRMVNGRLQSRAATPEEWREFFKREIRTVRLPPDAAAASSLAKPGAAGSQNQL